VPSIIVFKWNDYTKYGRSNKIKVFKTVFSMEKYEKRKPDIIETLTPPGLHGKQAAQSPPRPR
jgi:hypothetical protein